MEEYRYVMARDLRRGDIIDTPSQCLLVVVREPRAYGPQVVITGQEPHNTVSRFDCAFESTERIRIRA